MTSPRPREPYRVLDEELPPPMSPATLAALLASVLAGVALAVVVLPSWAPALAGSLGGAEPKAYWYLSRASGIVAYVLTWASMMLGVSLGGRAAKSMPGGTAAVFDLHQHTALLGLAFGLFHALVLIGDRYVDAGALRLLLPFAAPLPSFAWIALGQIALWGGALVGGTFYVRRRMGPKAWRAIHFGSFTVFTLALAHAVMAGSDGGLWLHALYAVTGGSLAVAVAWRLRAPRAV